MGEEQGGGAKIVLAILGVLLLLIITPIILFLGAGDEKDSDPYAPCLIEGTPIGDASNKDESSVKIPEQYRDSTENSARTAGLPVGIIAAQIEQESGWNPKATSPAGAQGIAQFMPGTWEEWGNGKDPFDPFAGLDAQGRYMKHLAGQIADLASNEQEKIRFTLAAYNAGAGNVQKYGGIPPFEETRHYVQTIMDNAQMDYSSDCEAPGGFDFGDLSTGEWAHPMPNSRLTSPYGARACPLASCLGKPFLLKHEGIDLAGSDPYFYAPTELKITYVSVGAPDQLYGSYGNYIFAQMTEAPYLVFEFHEAQDHSLMVKTGDIVQKGAPLGKPGATGNSSGIHIHFQINNPKTSVFDRPAVNNGKTYDPIPILRQQKVNIQ
ncbi:transglycosylase SLT domain-containing protein (plasmid) [Glutamicibacter mishrai]|uniref:transglycosylase SLT domain-containing protein n=1 Tax=Glutamicibacter mishrai TaxID=1775880 RepID=UPI0032EAC19F